MKKYCLLFLLFIAINPLQSAEKPEIYKWVDSNGDVHFSDKPHQGAEQIELPKVQTYSSPKIPVTEKEPEPTGSADGRTYQKLSFVQPEDQSTIRNPQGYISVILDLQPKLAPGDKVQLIFDGTPLAKPQPTTVFALRDIKRGSHTMAAQIVDAQGKVLNTSPSITIFMMPPRINMGKGSP